MSIKIHLNFSGFVHIIEVDLEKNKKDKETFYNFVPLAIDDINVCGNDITKKQFLEIIYQGIKLGELKILDYNKYSNLESYGSEVNLVSVNNDELEEIDICNEMISIVYKKIKRKVKKIK